MSKGPININSIFSIDSKLTNIEDLFNQIYVADNFYKWFNMKPFVWMNFDRDYLDVGCTGRVSFTIPPFSYELGVIELKKNEYIKFKSDGKYFGGTAEMKFYEKNGQLYYEEPHRLYARNNFIYWYYKKLLASNHVPYMENRFKKLEKILTRSSKSFYY